jgi:hypothetical protein
VRETEVPIPATIVVVCQLKTAGIIEVAVHIIATGIRRENPRPCLWRGEPEPVRVPEEIYGPRHISCWIDPAAGRRYVTGTIIRTNGQGWCGTPDTKQ